MICARVQHHPSRAHLLPELLALLHPLPVEVIEHHSDPPSPWAGYRRCLDDLPDCTHLLIIQDDAVPSLGFVPAVEAIAAAQPETPVCLFLGKLPRDVSAKATRAMKYGQRYVPVTLRTFMPIVAVLWPRQKAADFAAWADENPRLVGPNPPRSDDAMAGRWKLVTRQTVLACVPSIVEHPDIEPTTIGRTAQWQHNPRRAFLLAKHADIYDWSV